MGQLDFSVADWKFWMGFRVRASVNWNFWSGCLMVFDRLERWNFGLRSGLFLCSGDEHLVGEARGGVRQGG